VPASLQVELAQHGPPFLPQGWHVEVLDPVLPVQFRSLVAQPVPVGKVLVMQHGSPELPQVQRPDLHEP
jgi:hypothetical protein